MSGELLMKASHHWLYKMVGYDEISKRKFLLNIKAVLNYYSYISIWSKIVLGKQFLLISFDKEKAHN